MFLAMVWHARRRVDAVRVAEDVSEQRARLLERQEAFLHDVSHELRTPVTIARGHLELMTWERPASPELRVALDELGRIERIIDRLLLLAKTAQPDFVHPVDVDLEPFLCDVFLRWSGIAERAWKLEVAPEAARVHADPDALREALDALLENAVKYSEPQAPIELCASVEGAETVIVVRDGGTRDHGDRRRGIEVEAHGETLWLAFVVARQPVVGDGLPLRRVRHELPPLGTHAGIAVEGLRETCVARLVDREACVLHS